MNRIQLSGTSQATTRSKPKQKLTPRYPQQARPEVVHRSDDPCFFVPLHYEKNYAYPVLVWLHGPNDDHRQLDRVMPHVSVRNYVGVSLPIPAGTESPDGGWSQRPDAICSAYASVESAIEQAMERFNIASHRIFIAGFADGGTMALRLGLAASGAFAGAASFDGPVPTSHHPLSNLNEARSLPLLIAHGRDSDAYPVGKICEELRLFHVAGMSLHLRQYPCGHELTTQILSDLDHWMMQIVTGVDMAAQDQQPGTPQISEN